MLEYLQPRWIVIAAIVCLAAGAVGVFVGIEPLSPMLILAGEVLVILAAILITTPQSALEGKQPATDTTAPEQVTPRDQAEEAEATRGDA